MFDLLSKLPYELEEIILSYLDKTSLLRLRATCKYFNSDFVLATAFRSCVLRSSEADANSFMQFCKNPTLTRLVEDFTLDFDLAHLGYTTGSDLNNMTDSVEDKIPETVYNALQAIPSNLKNISSLRLVLVEGLKWPGNTGDLRTPTGFHWECHVKCFRSLFPDPPSKETTTDSATEAYLELKSLALHNIDAVASEIYELPCLKALLKRIESLSLHIAASPETDQYYFQITNMLDFIEGGFRDYFIDTLSDKIRSLDIYMPFQVYLIAEWNHIPHVLHNLTSLRMENVIFYEEHMQFLENCDRLQDLTLIFCDIEVHESETLISQGVFWHTLWERLQNDGRNFENLFLENSSYAYFKHWHSGGYAPVDDVYSDLEEDELEAINYNEWKEIWPKDLEAYRKLGGKGDIKTCGDSEESDNDDE